MASPQRTEAGAGRGVHPGAVDCDVHCAPASIDALLPHLDEYWGHYIERANVTLGGMALAYPPGAPTTGAATPDGYETLREGYLDAREPSVAVLNCLTTFEVHRNAYFSAAMASAVNDWVRTELLDRDDRLRASVAVTAIDPAAAVAEIDRVGEDPRFVQVLLPVRSDAPYGNKRYHPIYEAAIGHGLAVSIHAWGRPGQAPSPAGFVPTYLEDYLSNGLMVQAHVVSLVAEGVFGLHPGLRVVLSECGFTWLPALLWRLDKDWKSLWREVPWVERKPSEYVREHFWSTIQPSHLPADAAEASEQLELLATDRLLYASDHPHEHGPGTDRLLAALDDDGRAAVLGGNARELYELGG